MRLAQTLALLLLSHATASDAKPGCTATSTWPDGTTIERECIVEGEGKAARGEKKKKAGGISEEFAWLKDTRWLWNNWREVIFRANGAFLAPAEGCERENPKCKWSSDDDRIFVTFGNAGMHTLTASADQQILSGSRDSDGDGVTAERRG